MTMEKKDSPKREDAVAPSSRPDTTDRESPKEIGGRAGPEPTRYGDWENKGICSDF